MNWKLILYYVLDSKDFNFVIGNNLFYKDGIFYDIIGHYMNDLI